VTEWRDVSPVSKRSGPSPPGWGAAAALRRAESPAKRIVVRVWVDSRIHSSDSPNAFSVIVVLSLAVMATVAARHQLSAPPDLSGVDVDYRRAPRTVASAAEAGPLSFHIRRPAIAQFDRALGECDIL
jgi:hypothetical protein